MNKQGPISWMASHPVAANLLMLGFILGGLLFMHTMKQEVFPDFITDNVSINVVYTGADPEEIERSIVLVIEDAVSGIEGVDEISSSAKEGLGSVTIEALSDADIYLLAQDIQKEVDRITTFPEEAEEPTIRVMASKRKTVSLVIYGQTEEQILHELAEDFRDQLLQSENITQIELEGVRPLEINIEISQDNLRRYNLSLSTIAQRIRSASLDLPGGSVKTASGEILIRMRERKDTGLDFAQIPIITTQSGATIILGDIATITDGYEDTDYSARYNGYPAIMLQVYRVGNQTPIAIADAVKQQIENSKTSLPTGIYADIRYDASEAYSQRMDLLLRNSALGLTMVFITLALFLEIRLAFWVMAGIPIAFLGPFLFLPALGVSLNMISMFAFIIALGIVVDDAIIIGENVYHYRQEGYPPLTAAIRGAQEMATPITFSILTNIATFMPLFFMPGVMGKIFFMIPTVVILVFLLSLVESLFILPNHLAHLNDKQRTGLQLWLYTRQQKFSHTFRHWVKYRYGGVLDLTLKHRYLTVIAALALLIATLSYASSGRMGMSMFPKTESDFAQIRLSLPFGTPVEKTQKIVDHLIKSARSSIVNVDNGEQLIRGIFSEVGNGGSHKAVIRTYLAKPEIRDSIMSTDEFSEQWRSSSGEIAGIESLIFESDSGGPGSGSAITIELTHRDISVLEQASLQLATALRAYPMAKDIANSMSLGKQQLDFTLLADGESLGLTPLSVARQVRNAFYGAEILRQQRGRNEIKVMLRLPEDERVSMQDMYNFLVWTDKGVAIPLNEIVQVKQGHAFTEIKRRNGRRNVQITANVTPRSQSVEIVNDLKDQALPALVEQYPGLQFSFQGRQADMADSIGSLKLSFIFAVLGIYTMLAIPFKSYILPLIVIVSIPFGIIGAIFGHIIMGFNLSILSMLGIVALSGIVVNDSLVLISQAVHLEKETDLAPKEIIRAASIQRFRPIILTTLTTFFGLAPIILETSRQARMLIPMAVSIGFGIVFATLITLVLIPSLYLVIDDCKNFCKSKFS
ncbi:efflux RND transporter permease subunit [Methyloprofundus sp.]|uniref:efflux RND transporter permease subunit n=2 Tax=Methyloprofundus sp. TaxID=2020875 RepID=UPI003D138675